MIKITIVEGGSALNPDKTTIDFNALGQLEVKDNAISTAKLQDNSVTSEKLSFGTLKLLANVTIPSDTQSYEFTNLSDDIYLFFLKLKNTSSASQYYLYINSNTTDSNYYVQMLGASSTTVSASRVNDPRFAYLGNSDRVSCILFVTLDPSGYLRYSSFLNRDSNVQMKFYQGTSTFTSSSISSIKFKSEQIGALSQGSKILMYRVL